MKQQQDKSHRRKTLAPPNNLREYRESALLRQKDLAEQIDKNSQTIANIEGRRAVPRYETMREIVVALNVVFAELNLKKVTVQDVFPHTKLRASKLIDSVENFSSVA